MYFDYMLKNCKYEKYNNLQNYALQEISIKYEISSQW